jgi:metacaspase-1
MCIPAFSQFNSNFLFFLGKSAGCKDDQTSADASINGNFSGAMTWGFIETMKAMPSPSYMQLLKSIRDRLRGRYTQIPQMSTGNQIDMNTPFHI